MNGLPCLNPTCLNFINHDPQDWWHWLIEVAEVNRGGTVELHSDMGDGAEPWQREILELFLKEFGNGPYLTDW